MAPQQIQALADASEADAAARYLRRQRFLEVVADAVRRADALTRLESALRQPVR